MVVTMLLNHLCFTPLRRLIEVVVVVVVVEGGVRRRS